MVRTDTSDFSYLGDNYQIKLIGQILSDKKFANAILDIVSPNYFKDPALKTIVATIIDAKKIDEVNLDIPSLEIRIYDGVKSEMTLKLLARQLRKIEEVDLNDSIKIQEIAMNFCKYKEVKKTIEEISKIIDRGDVNDYHECESKLRKALEHGDMKDDGIDIFHNIKDVLVDDFRKPIPTGIKGLDEIMDGGLSKTELGVILAPFGVGKTTMMTKLANTGVNMGYKVLQIFFEDNTKVIQRKHLACWSGFDLNNLSLHKDEIYDMVKTMDADMKTKRGGLKLKKFSSDGTTMPIIKQYIRKLTAQGFKPDMILLDYIDCVEPSKAYADANIGEGSVMRQFESMLSELDIAGWTAVQGNRGSIGAEVVQANQMGGSIKKGQIGHFIVSIAKTLDQKENGTATMAILKSRFGKDGVVFEDIKFDNASIQIDMGDNKGGRTNSEHKQYKAQNEQKRINEAVTAHRSNIMNTNLIKTLNEE
jgi:replicative DNA helicase